VLDRAVFRQPSPVLSAVKEFGQPLDGNGREHRHRRKGGSTTLSAYFILQLLRIWVLATLSRRWTTRILVLNAAPLVAAGAYRGSASARKIACCGWPALDTDRILLSLS
jgi:Isoprenylcysteine carboxyl methyltransferase (ICMT) family